MLVLWTNERARISLGWIAGVAEIWWDVKPWSGGIKVWAENDLCQQYLTDKSFVCAKRRRANQFAADSTLTSHDDWFSPKLKLFFSFFCCFSEPFKQIELGWIRAKPELNAEDSSVGFASWWTNLQFKFQLPIGITPKTCWQTLFARFALPQKKVIEKFRKNHFAMVHKVNVERDCARVRATRAPRLRYLDQKNSSFWAQQNVSI